VTRGCFVAGTDTGVGKTRVCAALCRALAARGLRVAGMKPVATGAFRDGPAGLRSGDAVALRAAANVEAPYELVNPYCFAPAISPHLAAGDAGAPIDTAKIARCFHVLAARADVVVVEGTGGWLAPIGTATTMADVAGTLSLPVVLVVGLRLGCLNHAALTLRGIRDARLPFAGWIANAIDPAFARCADNVATLASMLGTPPIAQLPFASGESASAVLPPQAADTLLAAL
jgi:dethiobiotin synthetase